MADKKQSTGIFHQQIFQQFQRLYIEIVRRLVHHKQIRRLREKPGEQKAVALTA
jgi:hypothetical protein